MCVYADASKIVLSFQALQEWTQLRLQGYLALRGKLATITSMAGGSEVLQLLSATRMFTECTLGNMAEEFGLRTDSWQHCVQRPASGDSNQVMRNQRGASQASEEIGPRPR